jgi:hypothetical protein
MKPATDYIHHAARLARKLQKALDEMAAGLELVSKADLGRACN